MPQFAVLSHDWPHQHWDFLLERDEHLQTWRLAELPRPGQSIRAELIGDHRKVYLDYEGPVSGDRGSVSRWDGGQFSWAEDRPGRIVIELAGRHLRGKVLLSWDPDRSWQFIWDQAPVA